MNGSRARLGLILPSVNRATEADLYRCLPAGVTAHFTRMQFRESSREYYERMVNDVPEGAEMLSHAQVHALMFACTTGSLYGGLGYDQRIISTMQQHCTAPCSTTSTAVVEALRELGARRISIVTPYPDWLDELERQFIQDSGFEVTNIQGMGLMDCGDVLPEDVYRFAKRYADRSADVLFISCMGLRTLDVLPYLEKDLGMTVVSSNQLTLWKLLRMAEIPTEDLAADFGSFMRRRVVRLSASSRA